MNEPLLDQEHANDFWIQHLNLFHEQVLLDHGVDIYQMSLQEFWRFIHENDYMELEEDEGEERFWIWAETPERNWHSVTAKDKSKAIEFFLKKNPQATIDKVTTEYPYEQD